MKYGMGTRIPAGVTPGPGALVNHSLPKFGLIAQASTSLPDAIDLSAFAAPVMDQGQTGSCEGHGNAGALYTTLAAANDPLGWVPSPASIYRLSRCVGRSGPTQPLTDEGAQNDWSISAIQQWGVEPMTVLATDGRFSDCDPATINVEPTLGDLEKDVSNCYVGQYAITGDLVTGIAQALAQGLGVVIAIWCDTAFQNYTANSAPLGVPNFNDPQGGGHCIYLHGYYTAADGSKVFRGRNSWSTQWGKNGDYEMSSAAIACIMDARAMVAKKVSQ